VSPEAVLGAGYAAALLVAALALEWLSAHTHRRSLRFRTAGFEYRDAHDVWVCPEGEHLWPHEFDHERRLMRYRARAHVCNACPVKERCTDSDTGREIVRPLDPWPHSEAGRFHRVIALWRSVRSWRSSPSRETTRPPRSARWARCSSSRWWRAGSC
jgi:hypothetical protein